MWCGKQEAIVVPTKVLPDFDPSLLDAGLRERFLSKQNGYCTNCGLFQDFNRLSVEELRRLNALGKDTLTSDAAYATYPPPDSAVRDFNERHFGRRLLRWSEYFDRAQLRVERALFLRVWFGAGPQFAISRWGAQVSGLDMSPICLRYTRENVPGFQALEGCIDGMLEGAFLDSEPYDAIFIFHILNHSCDVAGSLSKLHTLTRPGGFVVFTNEIERKPQNPFHNFHASEPQLRAILLDVFDRVDRISDCEEHFVPHISPYTARGDIPDLVAYRSPEPA